MFYCFLADGFEEIEAVATIDILRRAGIEVKTVSVQGSCAVGAHKIQITADMNIESFKVDSSITGVILPGGMPGVSNLYKFEIIKDAVNYCIDRNLPVCAICAAPSILGKMGVLTDKNATCYPGFETELLNANVSDDCVVIDGNFITAKGSGCANEFAFAIVEKVLSKSAADDVAAAMQIQFG